MSKEDGNYGFGDVIGGVIGMALFVGTFSVALKLAVLAYNEASDGIKEVDVPGLEVRLDRNGFSIRREIDTTEQQLSSLETPSDSVDPFAGVVFEKDTAKKATAKYLTKKKPSPTEDPWAEFPEAPADPLEGVPFDNEENTK